MTGQMGGAVAGECLAAQVTPHRLPILGLRRLAYPLAKHINGALLSVVCHRERVAPTARPRDKNGVCHQLASQFAGMKASQEAELDVDRLLLLPADVLGWMSAAVAAFNLLISVIFDLVGKCGSNMAHHSSLANKL